jgi:hypothetical protein
MLTHTIRFSSAENFRKKSFAPKSGNAVVGILLARFCFYNPRYFKMRLSRTINTLNGPVQGKQYTFEGSKASAYLGIPYAEPPIGELRFKVN